MWIFDIRDHEREGYGGIHGGDRGNVSEESVDPRSFLNGVLLIVTLLGTGKPVNRLLELASSNSSRLISVVLFPHHCRLALYRHHPARVVQFHLENGVEVGLEVSFSILRGPASNNPI